MARGIVGSSRESTRHRRLADVQAGLRPRHRRVPHRARRVRLPVWPDLDRRRGRYVHVGPRRPGGRADERARAGARGLPDPGHRPAPSRRAVAALWSVGAPRSWSRPRSAWCRTSTRQTLLAPTREHHRRTAVDIARGDHRRSGSAAGWTPPRPPGSPTSWSTCSTDVRLVARGPKARGALQAAGLRADWVAESETSAEIAEFLLAEGVAGQRIAVQHHGAGDDGLDDRLAGGRRRASCRSRSTAGARRRTPPLSQRLARELAAGGVRRRRCSPRRPARAAWLRRAAPARTPPTRSARSSRSGRLLVAAVGPVTAEPLADGGHDARRTGPVRGWARSCGW